MNSVPGKDQILLKHLNTFEMLVHDRKIGGLYKPPPCQLPTNTASKFDNWFAKNNTASSSKTGCVCELRWKETEAEPVMGDLRIIPHNLKLHA